MIRALGALSILFTASLAAAADPLTGCEPKDNQRPVCTFSNPEDLAPLPGGAALLVSEYGKHDGTGVGATAGALALMVLETDERRGLFVGADAAGALPAEGWGAPDCPGPPPPEFSPHGIDLAQRSDGKLALAVVQHGGRESVELFEVTGSGADWAVEWRGCWIPPEDAWLNEVILLSDGSMMTSSMMPRGSSDSFEPTELGWLLHWTPNGGFRKVPNTDVRLANGFELSADERTLYLNSSMGDGLRRIDRATGEVTGHAELGSLDNSTWAPDGVLLVAHLIAGDTEDFQQCTDLRGGACPIPFQIVAVDPETMETSVRFDSAGSPMGAGTVGLQVGDELFIGSFAGDRILRVDLSEGSTTP
jgi:hypothetical protein